MSSVTRMLHVMPSNANTPLTTPTRRSTRYKIQAADIDGADSTDHSYMWLGSILHSRPTSYEDDLHQPEIEAINAAKFEGEEFEFDSAMMCTNFYSKLSRTRRQQTTPSCAKRQKLDQEIFNVGDTIFIKSQTGVPNVAVIIAMWNTEILRGEFPGNFRHSGMKVQVHWFMRPHQCAMVRKHRKFYQVCSCPFLSNSSISLCF